MTAMKQYAIKEVAKILGVSKTVIYRKLDRDSIKKHVVIVNRQKYVTEEGLIELKKASSVIIDSTNNKEDDLDVTNNNEKESTTTTNNVDIDVLSQEEFDEHTQSKTTEIARDEIEFLRRRNAELTKALHDQNQIILNNQEIHLKSLNNAEQLLLEKRKQLEERKAEAEVAATSRKIPWWKRMFGARA